MSATLKPLSRTTRRLIGFGRGVRLQASDRLAKRIGMADEVATLPGRQQDVGARLIDRLTRGANALDLERQVVERRRWIAGGILG